MAKVVITKDYIEVQVANVQEQSVCMAFPNIHFNRAKTVFRTSLRYIDKLREHTKGLSLNINSENGYLVKEAQRRSDTQEILTVGVVEDKNSWLYPHQRLGVELARINQRYGFFYDTRTGKTPMTLQIIADDIQDNPTHKWLILCPLILIENAWMEDSKKFFPDISVVSLHASTKAKRLAAMKQPANIYLQNIESFINYEPYFKEFGLQFEGAFVDESSTMKSHSAKFSKAAVDFSRTLKRWYILTGTPAPNGEYEYYRQLQSIDYYSVPQSWAQFKARYFYNESYNPQFEKLKVLPDKQQELKEIILETCIYVDKEDVLVTPGRTFEDVLVKMPDTLKQQYDQMKKELYIEYQEDTTILAICDAAKVNKLRQIASGFIYNGAERILLDDYKFKALLSLLETFGSDQCIIWCNYRFEIHTLQDLLGDKCASVYGEVSLKDKNTAIADFKAGRVQYLLANPKSADKGLTLTNAHICVYFTLNHSYELYKQSMERIYGSIHQQPIHCRYYHILAEGTVESVIKKALENKKTATYEVLDYIRQFK